MIHWMTTMLYEAQPVDGHQMLVRGCSCGRVFYDETSIVEHIKENADL